MKCPKCNTENPEGNIKCACGYEFSSVTKVETNTNSKKNKIKLIVSNILIFVTLLFNLTLGSNKVQNKDPSFMMSYLILSLVKTLIISLVITWLILKVLKKDIKKEFLFTFSIVFLIYSITPF